MSSDPDQPSEQGSSTDRQATPVPPPSAPPMGAPNPWAVGAAPGRPGEPVAEQRWNGFAITSFVLGILGGFCCLWAAAIGFGIAALNTIPKRNERGKGLAIAGIVLSVVWLLGSLGMAVFLAGANHGFQPRSLPHAGSRPYDRGLFPHASSRAFDPQNLDVFELQTGQCFVKRGPGETMDRVRLMPCSLPHDGEVFADQSLNETQFSSVNPISAHAAEKCRWAMPAYTKDSWALPRSTKVHYIYPDEPSGDPASDKLICIFEDSHGQRSGSLAQDGKSLTPEQNAYLDAVKEPTTQAPKADPEQQLEPYRMWAYSRMSHADVEVRELLSGTWSDKAKQPVADLVAELRLESQHLEAASKAKDVATLKQELAAADSHQGHQQEVAVRAALGLATDGGGYPAPVQSADPAAS